MSEFSDFLREKRRLLGITIGEFCNKHGFDTANYSKLEGDRISPPEDRDYLEKLASALELVKDSGEWLGFIDRARSATRPRKASLSEGEIVAQLPLVYRTTDGNKPTNEQIDSLIRKIKDQ